MVFKLIITLLLIAVLGFLLLSNNVGQMTTSPQPASQMATGTPAPTAIQAGTVEGTVVSADSNSLVVAAADGEKTVSLVGTSDFQKVVSGSIAGGNPVFATATRADLVAGKHVVVAIDEKTGTALAVIISD